MERKQYLDQIKELVQTVQMLLDANLALGNKQKEQKKESDRKIAKLQALVTNLQEYCKLMTMASLDSFRGFLTLL